MNPLNPSVLRAGLLTAWAMFFIWLWVTGEMARYLGPRTYWVLQFGAIILAAAAIAHLLALRSLPSRGRASVGEIIGVVVMLVPILAIVVVPKPELGALAAARKAAGTGVGAVGSFAPVPDPGRELSFMDIFFASESEDYAAAAGIHDGLEIDLLGFVTHPADTPRGAFELTRFHISCCAADAIPYSVVVEHDEDFAENTWLEVSGALERRDSGYVLVPTTVTLATEPRNPYLY
jgi:putative membrane protein